jgi:hypothetical protein
LSTKKKRTGFEYEIGAVREIFFVNQVKHKNVIYGFARHLFFFLDLIMNGGTLFTNTLLTLFFRQTFEMKPRKYGIWLTVNRLGVPSPFLKKLPPLPPGGKWKEGIVKST